VSAFVCLTDPDWYDFLRSNPRSVVNFWRKPTKNFKGLPGELFFCLITVPIRERFIGAVAKVGGFRRMTVRDAWNTYGEANGAASSTELLERLRRTLKEFVTLDDRIGCIILHDFRLVIDAPPLQADLRPGGTNPVKRILDEQGQALRASLTLLRPEPNTPFAPDYAPAERTQVEISRPVRDTAITREVKALYGGRCQICGEGPLKNGETYVEAHHVTPLGQHRGPDHPSNVLVLCPNHHAEFEHGAIMVDPATLTVRHSDPANRWHSSRLSVNPRHQLDPAFLTYHAENLIWFPRR